MANDTQILVTHWRDAVPNDRLAHLIRDVSRGFVRSLSLRLEEHGVPVGYWTFLRVLWETDGITQKELSAKAGVMEPTTFTAMKSMEALGYIVRKQQLPNRKNVYIYLTSEGRALKKKLVPLAIETNNEAAKGISASDLKITRNVLLTMLANLATDETEEVEILKRKPIATKAPAKKRAPAKAAQSLRTPQKRNPLKAG